VLLDQTVNLQRKMICRERAQRTQSQGFGKTGGFTNRVGGKLQEKACKPLFLRSLRSFAAELISEFRMNRLIAGERLERSGFQPWKSSQWRALGRCPRLAWTGPLARKKSNSESSSLCQIILLRDQELWFCGGPKKERGHQMAGYAELIALHALRKSGFSA
jgi:hypothetical protein